MAESNLSKYFENDPPSLFDQLNESNEKFSTSEVRDIWLVPDYEVDNQVSTIPCVSVELIPDPIAAAINTHCPLEIVNRKHANSENLTIDDNGIRSLINEKCYRSAIALTSRLLANYNQGMNQKGQPVKHTIHSLQLWFTRISLLIKIGEYEIARKEAEPFGQLNNSDMFYEFTQEQIYKSKKGSMPSFSFRLLLATLPSKIRPKEALNNLTKILTITRKIRNFFINLDKTNEAEFWKERELKVLSAMINCAVSLKNFDLAHQIFQNILELPNLSEGLKFAIFSSWGKVFISSGDVHQAEKKFSLMKANSLAEKLAVLVNKGLVAVAQNDYHEAHKFFQEAHELDRNNIMVINNLAVCFLYTGRMHEAIKLYERAIQSDPKNNLHETLLLNCATLYELESNEAKKKKIELLKIVSSNRADLEMSVEMCLKL